MSEVTVITERRAFFTTVTLAKYLDLSERYVRELVKSGEIPSSKPDVAGSNPAGGVFVVPLLMRFGRIGGGMAGIESRSHCRCVPSLAVACRGLMATSWRHFSPIPNRGDGIPSRREEPRMTNTGECDQLAAEIDEQLHHGRN